MKDRYKLNLFYPETLNAHNYLSTQEITDVVYTTTELRISILAMDFQAGTTIKYRKELENKWLNTLPTLDSIRTLSIRHKVNQDFFEAICKMKNLEKLFICTSSVENILHISKLRKLNHLSLDSFYNLTDISPLLSLENLKLLSISNSFKIENYCILGLMPQLIGLDLSGDVFAPKNLRLPTLKNLSNLKKLKHLDLSNTSIVDKSYADILGFESLERLDITTVISKPMRDLIMQNLKDLKAGFFTDWDYEKKKLREGKEW